MSNIWEAVFDYCSAAFMLTATIYFVITGINWLTKKLNKPISQYKYTVIERIKYPNGRIVEDVLLHSNNPNEVAYFQSGENNKEYRGIQYLYIVKKNK